MTAFRLADVINDSIVDGPGLRLSVYVQGCGHACPGCHNPSTHDFDGGRMSDTQEMVDLVRKNPLLSGITITGGEPFDQAEAMADLAEQVHAMGLNVVTYTGYTLEKLLEGLPEHPAWGKLLAQSDMLIDGPFILAERTLNLPYRGSKNQRLLSGTQSLQQGCAVDYP